MILMTFRYIDFLFSDISTITQNLNNTINIINEEHYRIHSIGNKHEYCYDQQYSPTNYILRFTSDNLTDNEKLILKINYPNLKFS